MTENYRSPFVGYKISKTNTDANLMGKTQKKFGEEFSCLKYSKFGVNLGPSRAIIPSDKFLKGKFIQRPLKNVTFPEQIKTPHLTASPRNVSDSFI